MFKRFFCILLTLMFALISHGAEIWIEGEDSPDHNWNNTLVMIEDNGQGASGGLALQLYTDVPDKYYASYTFEVPQDNKYALFLAISDPTADWVCSPEIQIDNQPIISTHNLPLQSGNFGGNFPNNVLVWVKPAELELQAGTHTIKLLIDKPRAIDNMYICFLDGIFLTTDLQAAVKNNFYISMQHQKSWAEEIQAAGSVAAYRKNLDNRLMRKQAEMFARQEGITPQNSAMVLERLKKRALPLPAQPPKSIHRIGVHGMEAPFVQAGVNDAQTQLAFELLARAGVDTLRTAELCWHRLGNGTPAELNFKEIDYQISQASKYGMNFMFTIGYPPPQYNVTNSILSTFKPEYETMFREYLRIILPRYDRYAQYWEYANEVDAPGTWWREASAREYVRDCKIIREELDKLNLKTPLMGISATYSRDHRHDQDGGRQFTLECFKYGIDNYVDGYSIHYSWPLAQQDFVRFFRSLSNKPLSNSEESGYSHPSDIIKLLARNFYLYNLESVYYYLSQDWVEAGNALFSGLFDVDWNPKLRLLSLAAGADAMKTRNLYAMAEPAPGVEAYLLQKPPMSNKNELSNPTNSYAIVLWQTNGNEEIGNKFKLKPAQKPQTVQLPPHTVIAAVNWDLSNIAYNPESPSFEITTEPLILYVNKLPSWSTQTPQEWLQNHPLSQDADSSEAIVPQI